MRSKLLTTLFVTVLGLTAAPLALEQLANLKSVAEKWTLNAFLSDIVIVHADDSQPSNIDPPNGPVVSSPDDFRWSGRVAAGRTVEIRGVNGNVMAEASSGNEVEVSAVKEGRRSDPREVEIRVVEHEGGVTICAVYPSNDPGHPNVCTPEGGSMNVQNNDVSVNFKVRLPGGVNLSARTVNGEVAAVSLGSDVDAKTVNGDIKLSTTGIARAKTVNGSITASFRNSNWTAPLEFKTVNGGVTLDLPAETNTEVRADTLNGAITSDFQLTVLGNANRKHLNGTIGSGGRQISIKTVNGSIRLNRAS
jgi:hypothetical protein